MEKRVTLKELAQKLGLAKSTVSMALNDHPGIKPETKLLVQKMSKSMGYTPHPVARALANQKTFLVGLVIEEVISSFYPEIIQGVEDVAVQNSLSTILCSTNFNPQRETESLSRLLERCVDGIILVPHFLRKDFSIIEKIEKQNVPLVCMLRRYPGMDFPFVVVDHESGGFMATKHLLDKGHRNIGFLKVKSCYDDTMEPRYRGYVNALREAGVEPKPHWSVEVEKHKPLAGQEGTALLLDQFPEMTAIFSTSDTLAMGALIELRKRNIEVPGQMAVIGFDGLFFGDLIDPPLTSVGQPRYEIGEIALTMLIQKIKGQKVHSITLQPKLISGGTT